MIDNKCYRILCKTGCTCCSEDNHYRGWYETKESAQARIDRFLAGVDYPVASQYARRGSYHIEECIFEPISKDRMIIEDSVYPEEFIKVNLENGELLNAEDDYLESYF